MSIRNIHTVVLGTLAAFALATSAIAAAQETTTPPPASTETAAPSAEQAPSMTATPTDAAPTAEPSATTSSTIGAPAAGKGVVVFFRPSRFVGAALVFTAREGETIIGSIGDGR